MTIHDRNLQTLATEMYKVTTGASPTFMKEVFSLNHNFGTENVSSGTRLQSQFYNPSNPKKVNTGLETLRSLAPKIWNIVPDEIKSENRQNVLVDYASDLLKIWASYRTFILH